MNKGVGMLISAIILQLLAFRSLVAAAQSHYEGLELLKRYAVTVKSKWAIKVSPHCSNYVALNQIDDLPTNRSIDVVSFILARPKPLAIVFDFDNGGGFGSCVLGFVQAFHWAVRSGLPLLVLRRSHGSVNTIFGENGVFTSGFPVIDDEVLERHGAMKLFKPTESAFMMLLKDPQTFKVATFRSSNSVNECLKDAFVSPARPTGPCHMRRTAAAAGCWQMKVVQALLPSFSAHGVAALPSLAPHFVGDFARVLAMAHRWQARPRAPAGVGSFANSTAAMVAPAMKGPALVEGARLGDRLGPRSSGLGWLGPGAGFPLALHVRTLDMGIEHEGKFASSIQGADRGVFEANIKRLVDASDFCVFDDGGDGGRVDGGVRPVEVFVASDSKTLKSSLRAKHSTRYRVNFFHTSGDRLKSTRGEPITASQFITLLEFWQVGMAHRLVAMAFFDRSLFAHNFKASLGNATIGPATLGARGPAVAPRGLQGHVGAGLLTAGGGARARSLDGVDASGGDRRSGTGGGRVLVNGKGPLGEKAGSGIAGSADGRTVSTFSKAAVALGGPDATAAFYMCHSLTRGLPAEPVAGTLGRVGDASCSAECDGRTTIHSL